MIRCAFVDPFASVVWQWEQISPNLQAPNSMQNTRRELAKNVHLETVQGILQFPEQHQPQHTSSYKIRSRRCARRMAHTDNKLTCIFTMLRNTRTGSDLDQKMCEGGAKATIKKAEAGLQNECLEMDKSDTG